MKNPKIVAQIVGRNEEQRFLKEVLERLSKQVDEIVFTDDCSDDNTYLIASDFCHVYKTKEPTFNINEGKLRSIAWSNLLRHANSGDWIIAIDCDEMLYDRGNLQSLDIRNILSGSEKDVVNVKFYHMWNKDQYRVDKLWAPNNSSRIFRLVPDGVFSDKALACGSEPTYVNSWLRQGNYFVNSNLVMKHLGYINDKDKEEKYKRYTDLDGGKFHQINHINSILDSNPVLINWGNFGL